MQHKFHSESNQRQNSFSFDPLLKAKLAGYSQEELKEYRQVFNVFDTGYVAKFLKISEIWKDFIMCFLNYRMVSDDSMMSFGYKSIISMQYFDVNLRW